jgi:hypothetical protein
LARDLFRKAFPKGEGGLTISEGFASAEGLVTMLASQGKQSSTLLHLDEFNVIAQKTSQDNTIGITLFNKLLARIRKRGFLITRRFAEGLTAG